MNWLDALAVVLGVKRDALIVAFLGAVISLKFVPEMDRWWKRLTMVAGGFLCAIYIAPAIADIFEFKARAESGITFLIGLLGMSVIAAVVKLVSSGELWSALKSKLGAGP